MTRIEIETHGIIVKVGLTKGPGSDVYIDIPDRDILYTSPADAVVLGLALVEIGLGEKDD